MIALRTGEAYQPNIMAFRRKMMYSYAALLMLNDVPYGLNMKPNVWLQILQGT